MDNEKMWRCRQAYGRLWKVKICLAKRKVGDKPFDMEFEFDVVSVAGTGGRSFGRVDGSSFLFYYIQQYECTSEWLYSTGK